MKTTDEQVIVEHNFNTTIEQLWDTITKPEKMRQWFFDNIPDFKAEVGFETQFPVHSEERTFTHLWKITEVIPFQKITYNWKYEEYPGDSFVTFELSQLIKKINLKVSMKVVEDFPDKIPEFTRESCLGGWNYFICGNLYNYLNG